MDIISLFFCFYLRLFALYLAFALYIAFNVITSLCFYLAFGLRSTFYDLFTALDGSFNPGPYKHSVPFLGHRQTVQAQIRRRVWSGSSLFATRIIYSKKNKNKKAHQTPLKLEMPGLVRLIRMDKSIRQMWVNMLENLSHVMRKPVYTTCKQQRCISACCLPG